METVVGSSGLGVRAGSGMGMLLGSRTATRDVWSWAWVPPVVPVAFPWGRGSVRRVRGWFENWIVDASEIGPCFRVRVSLLISIELLIVLRLFV